MAGMHQPSDFQVFRTLDRTSNARLLRSSTLSDGLALAHWYRDEAEILGYSDPGHHTLSLYLQGGWQTFRRDRPGLYGGPDRFCVMPAEHHSDWAVTRGLGFMHLYISPERLAGAAVRTLDCEPRSLQLEERTYIQDEPLAALCRTLERQDWNEPGERLLCTSLAHQAVDHLLLTGCGRRTDVRWQGGLAAHVRRRLADYIESHLEQPLELGVAGGAGGALRVPLRAHVPRILRPAAAPLRAGTTPGAGPRPAGVLRAAAPGGLAGLRLRQSEPFQPALPRSPWRHPGAVPRRPERLLKARRRQPAVVGRHSRSIK
ncbi:AraC family transcriptional regulator [Pseudomonas aeruginosa]|nr:AraC family transcriptional regulator [Pseudomonas aeruginosa]